MGTSAAESPRLVRPGDSFPRPRFAPFAVLRPEEREVFFAAMRVRCRAGVTS
jgi:hypothetical protein